MGQINASHKWDGGHERIGFFGFVTVQKNTKMKTGLNFY